MTAKRTTKASAPPGASELLRKRYIAGNSERESSLQQEVGNAEIAGLIYEARARAGITQQQLAGRVGTQKSVISRLEDSNYDGHSLGMLRRIARALGLKVEVSLRPVERSETSKPAVSRRTSSPLRRVGPAVRSTLSKSYAAKEKSASSKYSSPSGTKK